MIQVCMVNTNSRSRFLQDKTIETPLHCLLRSFKCLVFLFMISNLIVWTSLRETGVSSKQLGDVLVHCTYGES